MAVDPAPTAIPRRIGDNHPPGPVLDNYAEELIERLTHTHAKLLDRYRELAIGTTQLPQTIDDRETAERVTTFFGMVQRWKADAEALHKKEKAPYLALDRAIDRFFLHRARQLVAGLAAVRHKMAIYEDSIREAARKAQREEQARAAKVRAEAVARATEERRLAEESAKQDRRAAKEHLRHAEEAEKLADRAQQVMDAEPVKANIHTDLGQTGYLRERPAFEVIDPSSIPLGYLMPNEDAIIGALNEDHRAGRPLREIPGLRTFLEKNFQVKT